MVEYKRHAGYPSAAETVSSGTPLVPSKKVDEPPQFTYKDVSSW
jgi:hypothetical protein